MHARDAVLVWPHPHAAKAAVGPRAVRAKGELNIVEVRVVRTPEAHVPHLEHELRPTAHGRRAPAGHLAPVIEHARRELALPRHGGDKDKAPRAVRVAVRPLAQARVKLEADDVRLRHDLPPHVLPDSALGRVPDALAREALLAAQLGAGVGGVVDAELDQRAAVRCRERVRHVEREGQVAAHVLACAHAVHVGGAGPVHRVQVKQQPLVRGERGRSELPTVPQELVGAQLASNP